MKRKWLLLVLLLSVVFLSCSSPLMQFVSYRLSPDIPPTTGEVNIAVPGLAKPVTVILDQYAVPHIQSDDEMALSYAMGYMHGRDRRFQLEMMKMAAGGRLRELVGEQDDEILARMEIFSRMIGLYRDADVMLASFTPYQLKMAEAYSAGINAATANEPRPLEFRLLDYQPEPWQSKDIGLILAMISFGLCKNWEMELGRMELMINQLQTGSTIERSLQIWKHRRDMPPYAIDRPFPNDPFADIPLVAPKLVEYLKTFRDTQPIPTQIEAIPQEAMSGWSPLALFQRGISASNNWAVGGQWTGTGRSALSSDPHMPHMMPSMCYLAHVKYTPSEGEGYDVIGGMFIGMPAISQGTNGYVAWGPTSNWADISDLYVEMPAPDKPGHYLVNGKAVPFNIRREEFKIRQDDGSFKVEVHEVRETRHGVIVNDFVERIPENFPLLALRRSSNKGHSMTAIANLYRAKTVKQGREALYDFYAMNGHWALADHEGNVGYIGTPYLPKRTRHLGTFPVPGWGNDYEWEEFFTPDQLPWIENPEVGFVGTANNLVINPISFEYPIAIDGEVPHRSGRIYEVLGQGNDGQSVVQQLSDLHRDGMDLGWRVVYDLYREALTPLIVDDDELVADAARRLLDWDGDTDPQCSETTIYQSVNAYTFKRAMEDEVGPKTLHFYLTYFNIEPMFFDVLGDDSNPAWDDRRTERTERAAEVVREQFHVAVHALAERYGDNIDDWTWSEAAPFVIQHSFGGIGSLADYVNSDPLPTMGVTNAVNKHQFKREEMVSFPIEDGAVMRLVVDLNDMPGSIMSLPGGQSGRPGSPHYQDLLPLYIEGRGVSLERDFGKLKQAASGEIYLTPAP